MTSSSAPSAAASLRDAAAWLGLLLDEDKSQTPSTRTKFLGSWEVSSYDGDAMLFALHPTHERVASITQELAGVFRSARVAHGRLLSLRGKLTHLFSVMTSLLVLPDGLPVASNCRGGRRSVARCVPRALMGTSIDLHSALDDCGVSMLRPAVTVVSDASWPMGALAPA